MSDENIEVKPLVDEETDKVFYPLTHQKAVFDGEGKALDEVIGTESIKDIGDGTIKGAIKALKKLLTTWLDDITNHIKNKSNPHEVTKSQVGLGNVPNVATNDQTPTYTAATTLSSLRSGEKLSVAFGKIAKAVSDFISHIKNMNNPHNVTKAQVGLGNCNNTADSDKSVKYAESAGTAVDQTARDNANSKVSKSGDTMTGDLDLQGNLRMNGRAIYDVTYIRGKSGREMDVMAHDNSNGVRLCGLFSESVNYSGDTYVDHRCNNLHYSGSLVHDSSKLVKENVIDMTEEESQKILELRVVDFDYKKGFGEKNQMGFIAEEVQEIIPKVVHIPEGFDEKNFDESKGSYGNEVPSIDYVLFIPLIIKQLQIQQKEIDELKNKVNK